MASRKSREEIEKAALTNVQKDFKAAATHAHGILSSRMLDVAGSIKDIHYPYNMDFSFTSGIMKLEFLQSAAPDRWGRETCRAKR